VAGWDWRGDGRVTAVAWQKTGEAKGAKSSRRAGTNEVRDVAGADTNDECCGVVTFSSFV
jgi:hypothetical protein